jgi:hypothetical protein
MRGLLGAASRWEAAPFSLHIPPARCPLLLLPGTATAPSRCLMPPLAADPLLPCPASLAQARRVLEPT